MQIQNSIPEWEQRLTNIIEKTNSNIQYLSKSVNQDGREDSVTNQQNRFGVSSSTSHSQAFIPPPPPSSSAKSTNFSYHIPPHHPETNPLHYQMPTQFQQNAKNMFESSQGAGVTRPLPKHVEDDLTNRIGSSIKRSVDRSINDKIHTTQTRLDTLSEKLDSLTNDHGKVHKQYGIVSRSLSTQERAIKWLKQESDNQKASLEKIQLESSNDRASTESLQLMLERLQQRYDEDSNLNVTPTDLKRGLKALHSVMDNMVSDTKNMFHAELRPLRQEIETLRGENFELRNALKNTENMCFSFTSSFNNDHIKSIISSAVNTHFLSLESKILASVRASISPDLETTKKDMESSFDHKLRSSIDNLFRHDSETVDFISKVVRKSLKQNEEPLVDTVSNLLCDKLISGSSEEYRRLKRDITSTLKDHQLFEVKDMIDGKYRQLELNWKRSIEETNKHRELYDDEFKKLVSIEVNNLIEKNQVGINKGEYDSIQNRIESYQNRLNDVEAKITLLSSESSMKSQKSTKKIEEVDQQLDIVRQDVLTLQKKLGLSLEEMKTNSEIERKAILDTWKNDFDGNHIKMNMINDLERKLNVANEMIDKLSLGVKESLSKHDIKVAELIEKINYVDSSSSEKYEKLKELEDNITSIRERIGKYVNNAQATEEEPKSLYELKTQILALEQKISALERTSADLNYQIQSTNGSNDYILNETKRTSEALKPLTMKLSSMEQQLKSECGQLRDDFVRIQENVISINSQSMERIDAVAHQVRHEISLLISTEQSDLPPSTQDPIMELDLLALKERIEKVEKFSCNHQQESTIDNHNLTTLSSTVEELKIQFQELSSRSSQNSVAREIDSSLQTQISSLDERANELELEMKKDKESSAVERICLEEEVRELSERLGRIENIVLQIQAPLHESCSHEFSQTQKGQLKVDVSQTHDFKEKNKRKQVTFLLPDDDDEVKKRNKDEESDICEHNTPGSSTQEIHCTVKETNSQSISSGECIVTEIKQTNIEALDNDLKVSTSDMNHTIIDEDEASSTDSASGSMTDYDEQESIDQQLNLRVDNETRNPSLSSHRNDISVMSDLLFDNDMDDEDKSSFDADESIASLSSDGSNSNDRGGMSDQSPQVCNSYESDFESDMDSGV